MGMFYVPAEDAGTRVGPELERILLVFFNSGFNESGDLMTKKNKEFAAFLRGVCMSAPVVSDLCRDAVALSIALDKSDQILRLDRPRR